MSRYESKAVLLIEIAALALAGWSAGCQRGQRTSDAGRSQARSRATWVVYTMPG